MLQFSVNDVNASIAVAFAHTAQLQYVVCVCIHSSLKSCAHFCSARLSGKIVELSFASTSEGLRSRSSPSVNEVFPSERLHVQWFLEVSWLMIFDCL